MPDPGSLKEQPVQWWMLLRKNGFEVEYPREAMRIVEWRLAGRPHRILRRGGMLIPVFRRRSRDSEKASKLFDQHYLRAAAYCFLLEATNPGCMSPYAIVLYGVSHFGQTIPRTRQSEQLLVRHVNVARGLVQFGVGQDFRLRESKCGSCRFAKPDRQTGLSRCGQRFKWVPPYTGRQ